MAGSKGKKFDWVTIFIYIALVAIGWVNIYSASFNTTSTEFFDFSHIYLKQLVWISLSLILIPFILAIDSKFYERFSSVIYIVSLISLIGLFVLGKNVNGATSWYFLGGFSIQPSEFAKAATALALAKYVSDIQTDLKSFQDQIKSLIIVFLPALLIIPQPDPGSALVYVALIFPLYREGLHFIFIFSFYCSSSLCCHTCFWYSLGFVWHFTNYRYFVF